MNETRMNFRITLRAWKTPKIKSEHDSQILPNPGSSLKDFKLKVKQILSDRVSIWSQKGA